MTGEEFDQEVELTCKNIVNSLSIKGKEYRRNGNVFHNFEVAARKKNTTRESALSFMAIKHEISIEDMVNDLEKGILPTEEMVEEKFGDAINYNILQKAMFLDRIRTKE